MQHVFFLNFVKVPFRNYGNLSAFGVSVRGRNFYLSGIDGVRLGCWHVLPKKISEQLGEDSSEADMEKTLSEPGYPIFVYLHGNAMDRFFLECLAIYIYFFFRSTNHRVQLYNVLSSLNFHVLAIDYRGYGDSEAFPTEIGLIEDSRTIIKYARKFSETNNVFVWGHSMGTGVAIATVVAISDSSYTPLGLVLEAPFNNLHDVIFNHPFSSPFRWMPRFEDILVKPLQASGLRMNSDTRIGRLIGCPILIMHAADDQTIPVKLGRLLRDSAVKKNRDVKFVEFDAKRGFQHKFIHLAAELPSILLYVFFLNFNL
ncbi:unnamed protein product [Enterobius vermicularis]|uniref:Lysophosphatidylserine lipase ABHD12 n=1 Tax=Enterobius vermicularis TaxID=51028 RepID=A0A0N4VDQ1_ENTVE|nr:unnamed protein product [Enterobius vermicularis]